MEDKNELNDIILNKSSKSNRTKKVLLTIATFSIVLIIVVVIMNRFTAKTEVALRAAFVAVQAGRQVALLSALAGVALLLAGPALSLPSLFVIYRVVGGKKTLVFCLLTVVMSTAVGFVFGTVA